MAEVSRGEKMTLRGTDPESYITKYTSAYEDSRQGIGACLGEGLRDARGVYVGEDIPRVCLPPQLGLLQLLDGHARSRVSPSMYFQVHVRVSEPI